MVAREDFEQIITRMSVKQKPRYDLSKANSSYNKCPRFLNRWLDSSHLRRSGLTHFRYDLNCGLNSIRMSLVNVIEPGGSIDQHCEIDSARTKSRRDAFHRNTIAKQTIQPLEEGLRHASYIGKHG